MGALCKYFSGAVASLVALFSPLLPLVWSVISFILFDFLTGVWASAADCRREGKRWYFESHLAWRTVEKLGFTTSALAMTFVIDVVILSHTDLHLTRLFTGFVCGVELWSFLENACRISHSPLLRHIRNIVRQNINKNINNE